MCEDCGKKWIVQPDTLDGRPVFLCFDTEREARTVYEHIERYDQYAGIQFKRKSAVLLAPKEAGYEWLE